MSSAAEIAIVAYTGYIVEYTVRGRAFTLHVTDQMCNYSLGEEIEVSSATFACMAGDPDCGTEKAWWWPERGTLDFGQLRTLVEDNHEQFGRAL